MRTLPIIIVMLITNIAYANDTWIWTGSGHVTHPPQKNVMVFGSPQPITSPESVTPFINQAAQANNLDPALIHAVVQAESNYDKDAISPKGAKGLMQLMDQTAKDYRVTDSYDPQQNITAGTTHLRDLIIRHGNLEHALAAYNAGTAAVDKYNGIPPYTETRQYVKKVMSEYKKTAGGIIISDRRQAPMMVRVHR